jgi:hypothetical protein
MTNARQKKRTAAKKAQDTSKKKAKAPAHTSTIEKEQTPPPRLWLKLKLGNNQQPVTPPPEIGSNIRSSITPPPPLSKTEIDAAKKAVNDFLGSDKADCSASSHKSAAASASPQPGSVIELLDAQDGFEGGMEVLSEDEQSTEEQIDKQESGIEDEDTPSSDRESEGE